METARTRGKGKREPKTSSMGSVERSDTFSDSGQIAQEAHMTMFAFNCLTQKPRPLAGKRSGARLSRNSIAGRIKYARVVSTLNFLMPVR